LVDIAVDTLHADKSMLLVWDAERQRYVTRSSRGFSSAARTALSFARDEGLVAEVIASGGPVVVEDALSDPRRASEPDAVMHLTEVEGIRSSIHVPVHVDGEVFGIFNAAFDTPHAFGADEQRLFVALAQRGALAIENAQLYEQAQELAVVAERQRLARDLHDAVTQTLFSASLIAEVLPRIWSHSPEEGMQRLEEVRQMTRGALAEMRTLLLELRPTALMEADLGGLLRQLAEAINGRARVPVAVEVEGECTCAPQVKVALYRIAQEALNNVAKHANATEARVSLRCGPEGMELHISDDGRGFDLESVPPDHLGLTIMRERADAIGADLTIESISEAGTTVTVVWPGKGTAGVC
ncbi:MAG: GAF domain-containing sensor histidine kinase, partial [Anaerolineales bacterium]|nr:GAF domain-containing sensor histidine kinase [Anaerolineales bacterium]